MPCLLTIDGGFLASCLWLTETMLIELEEAVIGSSMTEQPGSREVILPYERQHL